MSRAEASRNSHIVVFIHFVATRPLVVRYSEKKLNVRQEGVGWLVENETDLHDNAMSVPLTVSGPCARLA